MGFLQVILPVNFHLTKATQFFLDPPNQRPCEPQDFLIVVSPNSTTDGNDDEVLPPCLPSCYNTEYLTHVTDGKIETGAITRYFDVVGADYFGDPE